VIDTDDLPPESVVERLAERIEREADDVRAAARTVEVHLAERSYPIHLGAGTLAGPATPSHVTPRRPTPRW
jgi:hypothetical protein